MLQARVTGVPVNGLLTRGQQYKVFSQICRETSTAFFVFVLLTSRRSRREIESVRHPHLQV